MRVTKRNGELEEIAFDKILTRIKKIGQEANIHINYQQLVMKVIDQLYDTISTTMIDELAAEQCAALSTLNPDYGVLAGRIIVSNHQKNTDPIFSNVMRELFYFEDIHGNNKPLVSNDLWNFVSLYSDKLNEMIFNDRDYLIDYFGFKTLERAYLFKKGSKIIERPQHMWMRVSVGIHGDLENPKSLELIKETYDLMSLKYFTHATPTLFNAGTPRPQMSSCYLLAMEDDSIDGIFNTLKDCANISKYSGGIGLHIHNIRAKGSHIQGTNGITDGIVPMLRVFNNTARYVNQCFTPDTWVYSKNGPMQMNCVTLSDELITIDGSFKKVNNVIINNVEKEILEIRVTNSMFPIKVTKEHEIYLIKNQSKMTNYNVIKHRLDKNIVKPNFYNASEITINDLVGFPIPTYEKDNENNDLDYYKFYGMMLGDGHICRNGKESGITLGTLNKAELITFTNNYLLKKNIKTWINEQKGCVSIKWSNSNNNVLGINRELLYDNEIDNNKQINSEYLNLPKHKIIKIIEGLLKTDGSNLKELYFYSTSLKLVMQLRYLLLRIGILTSGNVKNNVGQSHVSIYGDTITNKKISYCLRIPKHPILRDILNFTDNQGVFFKYFEWNGFLWGRIKSIKNIFYKGEVYDFNMIDNHNYLTDMGLVHNSGKRNGSFAIYLEPWHPDIFDFLEMRKNHGDEELKARDLFYALWVSDLFMERVKEKNGKWSLFCPHECPGLSDLYGTEFNNLYEKYEQEGKARKTVNARDLWFAILDAQMETGTPYLLYKDAANQKSNQKNLGTIKSSNLCVAPETLVLTIDGHKEIQTLVDQEVDVWNGEEFSRVKIMKTGEEQDLIDVFTDDGSKLSCTPYHKFYIQENYSETSIKQIEAKDLKPNDKIIKSSFPVIDGNDKFLYPYTHGFFCGDGTYSNISDKQEQQCNFKALDGHFFCKRHIDFETENFFDLLLDNVLEINEDTMCNAKSYCKKPMTYLYGDKKELIKYMNYRTFTENNGRIVLQLPLDIEEKFNIPSHTCSIKDKLDWFAGYCDADGTLARNGDNEQLQVCSINYDFLTSVKIFLQTCGINPKVKMTQIRDKSYLPDGKGGYKYYNVKPTYRLLVTSYDLYNLVQLGFSPKRLKISGLKPSRNANQFIKILKVEYNNRIDDTYCFTEPKRHMGIFNGIITGQCTEIIEYSDDKETAVCNLASVGLPTFVNPETKHFDYDKLHEVTKVVTNNLNKVIDINYYPTEKTKRSNMRHRPIGIGVQGLADTFVLMDIPFYSDEAKELNKLIFETMYHAALERSNEIAIERKQWILEKCSSGVNLSDILNEYEYYALVSGTKSDANFISNGHIGSYCSFSGSPAAEGILQFDMWSVKPSERYNWFKLKESIKTHGLRNSLLVAPMPTASTSQILGFNECFEPFTSNLYSRRTLAGEFVVVNKYLMKELIQLGHWNEQIKNNIIANKGSIQQLKVLPEHIRNKYKIVWEIPMKHIIDMAADRGPFICQSQSLNLWMEEPVYNKLTSMHFYAWEKGLKTGIYYLRRKAKHQAQQFTIEPDAKEKNDEQEEICEMCSA
jgi:ribonucleoside-diphosphate reductase alpha chain